MNKSRWLSPVYGDLWPGPRQQLLLQICFTCSAGGFNDMNHREQKRKTLHSNEQRSSEIFSYLDLRSLRLFIRAAAWRFRWIMSSSRCPSFSFSSLSLDSASLCRSSRSSYVIFSSLFSCWTWFTCFCSSWWVSEEQLSCCCSSCSLRQEQC